MIGVAPHDPPPRSRFIPGRPCAVPIGNLVRAESMAWLGLQDAYRQLAETPVGNPAEPWRRRKIADWRRRWEQALLELDQARRRR